MPDAQPQRPRRRVAARDGVWLQDSPTNRMLINAVFTCDRMPISTLVDLWRRRIMAGGAYPRFERRITYEGSRAFWEDVPDFDLGEHIFAAPPTVENAGALRSIPELQEYVSSQAARPLPVDRPLWQIQFIENFRDERSALYVRIHHVMADGMSLLPVVFSLMDQEAGATQELDEIQEKAKKLVAKPPSSAWMVLKTVLLGPFLLLQKMLWRGDRSVLHGQAVEGRKRVAWTPPIDISRVKEVKDAFGATLNDVLMTAMAAAFEKYAREQGNEKLRTLRMSMPVNVRPNTEEPRMENKFAAVMLDLPVGFPDSRSHVAAMSAYLDTVKRSVEPLFTYGTVLVLLSVLPASWSRGLIDWLANKCTCVISNVPGPPQPVYLAGHRLRSMMFWVPQRSDIAVGVSMISFDGRLSLGVISDTAVVPEPQVLVDAFCEEFRRLRETAGIPENSIPENTVENA